MASSKLQIKSIDRTKLYFNKFKYRVYITEPNSYWVQYCDNLDEYKATVAKAIDEHEKRVANKTTMYSGYSYRSITTNAPIDEPLVKYLIKLRLTKFKEKLVGLRHGGNNITVYTNDLKIVRELIKLKPDAKLTEAHASPQGVMYFKKTPPAKFRVYCTSNKVSADFKDDMLSYLARTPDMRPSSSFSHFLKHKPKFAMPHSWLWSQYFIDYDDEKNLMMLHILFPGAIGKSYKLEKKTV